MRIGKPARWRWKKSIKLSLRVLFRAFSVIFAIISQHMHNTFTTLLFIYIRLHVSTLYGPSSGHYKVPSLQTKMRKYLQY
jgi:hypothetical protein